jgi:hypothetical protein
MALGVLFIFDQVLRPIRVRLSGRLFYLEIAPIRYPMTDDPGQAFVFILPELVEEAAFDDVRHKGPLHSIEIDAVP